MVQKSLPLVIKPFLRISKRKKRLSRVITAPAHTAASSASRSHQGLRVKIRLLRVNCADIVYFKHWLLKEWTMLGRYLAIESKQWSIPLKYGRVQNHQWILWQYITKRRWCVMTNLALACFLVWPDFCPSRFYQKKGSEQTHVVLISLIFPSKFINLRSKWLTSYRRLKNKHFIVQL